VNVKLVSLSQPSASTGCQTADQFVAYCARVSNPDNQNNNKTAPGLLKYLIKHGHWSPFEMVSLTLEIETTRDISHQIVRHRSFSFQEFSQRYAQANTFEVREARLQDPTNRQNSVRIDRGLAEQRLIDEKFSMAQHKVIRLTREAYECALDNGIAKEQARALLPEGMTGTTLYMAGTLRSWIHYCKLRMANGTQAEHAEIAKRCWDIIGGHFPSVREAVDALDVLD
jgi:thymidylate synthase (FAD)